MKTASRRTKRVARRVAQKPVQRRWWQQLAMPLAAVLAVALAGCMSPQNAAFQAAAEAQQQLAEQTALPAKGTLDTQATYLKLVGQMQTNELWFASLAHIDALEQRWGVTPESNLLRADALRHTDMADESARFYQRLTGTPLEASGLHGLGLLAGGRAQFADAVRLLEQARRLRPADATLLGDLGYALLRNGDDAQARLRLMQALQLKPDSLQTQLNLALYFEARNDPAQATALMEANRIPEPMRLAVRNAALQLRGLSPVASLPTSATRGSPKAAADVATRPLTLKASGWSGLPRASAGEPSAQAVASAPSPFAKEPTP